MIELQIIRVLFPLKIGGLTKNRLFENTDISKRKGGVFNEKHKMREY